MFSGRISFAALTALVITTCQASTLAQFYDGCGCGAVTAAPVSYCTPIQPVHTTCYQTIPVTTYARERQTVEVPTYETAYEERDVTVYRPVTTSREVEVPYTTYQNVTEYRTVNRDMGRWVTRYHPVAKSAPCQVDPRPGVIGWLNRTGYSMQTAFMPNYMTSREYVPSMVSCQVPYVRQVAIQSTRRVSVQETNMVAERKTEKVPVQRLVMKKQEVTVMRPQTAYRTVPIGTSMAYGPFIGGTQMAYGYPIIEDSAASRSALAPQPDSISERGAFKPDDEENGSGFKRSADGEDTNVRGSSFDSSPPLKGDDDVREFPPSATRGSDRPKFTPAVSRRQQVPHTADAAPGSGGSGWHAARKSADRSVSLISEPRSTVSLTDSKSDK